MIHTSTKEIYRKSQKQTYYILQEGDILRIEKSYVPLYIKLTKYLTSNMPLKKQ